MSTESDTNAEWYRDAVIYQTHVRAFQDSDDDGIGDFEGLTERLDYLQDLGVTALWLLPFYPSPLRDDGYDTADYRRVHPDYGTMRSFRRFLREAHRRDLKVVTELVINHTSDQHPWFQKARRARPGSKARDFYVWSDNDSRYDQARIIFSDFETSNWAWDHEAGAYYWHRFYSHQPDLNYDNPAVHDAVFGLVDFWLDEGVDGLRLDAIPYLYERDGTNCENLPETHAFLRRIREHIDRRFDERMVLAEANQWPEDAVAYFGDGDECHMAFHFPVMPRLFMAVQMEDRFPITEILEQTPAIPPGCQWAMFLRNHDELTLEMVTDEERDYMYRVYARDRRARVNLGIRRRLAPLMGNDRRRIELMNALLFSLPGTPILYYGDELGMGDNVFLGDRNGVRTPMQWSPDRNAGFSRANPQSLYLPVIIDPEYHYEKINVELQSDDPTSLLRWTRQMITLRNRTPVFGRGSTTFLSPENGRILAFVREHDGEQILVVANLSRTTQYAELDLAPWQGLTPIEMLGGSHFPPIGSLPYLVTLGPYGFMWLSLEAVHSEAPVLSPPIDDEIPTLRLGAGDKSPVEGRARARLARILPHYLEPRRWFGSKSRAIRATTIVDVIPVPGLPRSEPAWLVLVEVDVGDGDPKIYLMPMALIVGDEAERWLRELSHGVVAQVESPRGFVGVLGEALWSPAVCDAIAGLFKRPRTVRSGRGELRVLSGSARRSLVDGLEPHESRVLRGEQSNTSVAFGDRMIMKIFRRLDAGPNPELELGAFLDRERFEHVAPFGGGLEYSTRAGDSTTIAVLHGFVPNEGDAWEQALGVVGRFLDDVRSSDEAELAGPAPTDLLERAEQEIPDEVATRLGQYVDSAELLGRRTAELHLALARPGSDPAMAVASFTHHDRRSLYQTMRSSARRTLQLLERRLDQLDDDTAELADRVLDAESEILARYDSVQTHPLTALRIRTHGDLHLGQVLHTGHDFTFLDFEGEPARSIGERRLKRSPLRDVAGMIRSYDYAARHAANDSVERGTASPAEQPELWAWAGWWSDWIAAAYLGGYLELAADAPFMPDDRDERAMLLDAYILEKAIYELAYELDNRPGWVGVPIAGILRVLDLEP